MTRKRKDNDKKTEKIVNEETNIDLLEKIQFRILKLILWCFTVVMFFTVTCAIILGVYVVKHTMANAELPQFDMNEYWGTYPMNPKQDISIKPYKVEFSDMMIKDLKERLLRQRPFQPSLEDTGFLYGFNSQCLTNVLDFWKNKYDFKERESFFNKYDHYTTNIQGLNIHYMHVKPVVTSDVKVLTLLLLHGWPGSVREFYEIIPKLTTPNAKYKFVFEVIAPSLPGFGFSEAAARPWMKPTDMAIVMSKLMERIGRKTYYVHGGEIGHSVGSALATIFPSNILGFHTSRPTLYHPITFMHILLGFISPGLLDPEIPNQSYSVNSFLQRALEENGYLDIQANIKPDTIGIALTESPAGLAAYILESSISKYPDYQIADGCRIGPSLTSLLDNVMVYWISNSITSSMRVHADRDLSNLDLIEIDVPTWGLKFKHDQALAPLSVLKKKYKNYLHTTMVNDSETFAAMVQPEVVASDIFGAVNAFVTFHIKNSTTQDHTVIPSKNPETIYDFSVTDIHGREIQLDKYRGYLLLLVNVASECGLTNKNYQQLIELYEKYEEKGLRILAFPCNQFGFQEPGSSEDIISFTKARGVRFDVFSKVEVNGDSAHPLWKFLKKSQGGTLGDWIKWNFSKFIVNRDGIPIERFGPDVDPLDLEPYIAKNL